MPVMDGITCTKSIVKLQEKYRAENPELPEVKIFALSAFTDNKMEEKCLAAGMTQYLTKPVSHSQIKACMETAFGDKFEHVVSLSDA